MSQPRRRKYIYTDHSAGDQVVFECIAEGISEADELYKQKTGRDAEKQSYVGCQIKELDERPAAEDVAIGPGPTEKARPVLEEPDVKSFIERRGIRSEDLAVIEELAAYPSELAIELVHNLFNLNHERSAGALEQNIKFAQDADRRHFFELFQKLLAAYDWATCYNLVRVLEERKGTPPLLKWEIDRTNNAR